MERITVIGGGSWGTTLANLLVEKGYSVIIYDVSEETVNEINECHTNQKLPNIILNHSLKATNHLVLALTEVDLIVLALPTAYIRTVLKDINKILTKSVVFCNVSKGIELKTHKRVSEIVSDELDENLIKSYVALSGPSHAEEVILKKITSVVASSNDFESAKRIQKLFSNDYFRVYTSTDLISVELSGSLKNIFAIASGIVDGLGYGINTKSALITRGLVEMKRIVSTLGGDESTLNGLVGVGDLIVTCTSALSRNYSFGLFIGKGLSFEVAQEKVKMVVEGTKTCKSAYNLSKELDLKTPIIDSIYHILFDNANPRAELNSLMNRRLIEE
ncbi:MAG: NAD(P)-dependent glycerol-3-phosphate dehydrogenase [Tenericutes bacterium]|nr:NAD(P)-dependent glycerol-3-phosphate dehydrogenase [Mycoplasmatota bacterium]